MKIKLIPSVGIQGVSLELDVFESQALKQVAAGLDHSIELVDIETVSLLSNINKIHSFDKEAMMERAKNKCPQYFEAVAQLKSDITRIQNFITKITAGSSNVRDVEQELFGSEEPLALETDVKKRKNLNFSCE